MKFQLTRHMATKISAKIREPGKARLDAMKASYPLDRLDTILQPRGAGVRFIEVVVSLAIRKFEHRRLKLAPR